MYLNRLSAIFDFLFGQRRRRALCPVSVRVLVRSIVIVGLILTARSTMAGVALTGDFFPVDNPFTQDVDEGIPDGNSVNINEAPNHQTFFEGRHTDGANLLDPADDTNQNFDITVGKTSSGDMVISSQTALRDMNLIIGDKGTLSNGQTRVGSGVVRINGFAAVFNNDPYILPSEVQGVPGFASQKPRLSETGATNGFDLYVGKYGSGTLQITAGGRAEIEDAVLVGDNAGATGNLVIDGIDSYLGNGGSFAPPGGGETTADNPHLTIIGRQGTGNLTISTGATMATQVIFNAGGNTGVVGASLGSLPYTAIATSGGIIPAGGSGTATITGNGSMWSIGGSLQIGGFDIGTSGSPTSTGGDLEGDDVQYGSQAGRGNLYVNDGGLVVVQNASGVVTTGNAPDLVMAVGRFGVVKLSGGTILIGAPEGGSQNLATPDNVQVINDGLITGTGRINTGSFRNRYLGKVRVDAGQSLLIDATAAFSTAGGDTPIEPLSNYGTIEVLGTSQAQAQLEFMRSPSETQDATAVRPFVNLPLVKDPPLTPPAFGGGLISAQYANLRFGSGLQNQSLVAFTAGTNNISGRVVTVSLDPLDSDADGNTGETAKILVSGPGTTAIFADDLAFGDGQDLNLVDGGKVVVLNQHSFVMSGGLGITLSYTHPSLITVAGDVGIGQGTADLTLNLASDALHSLKSGDAFQLISFGGDIGNVNLTDPLNPVPDLTNLPLFKDIDVSPDVKALYGLDVQIQFSNEGVYAVFLNPAAVGTNGAKAPDFNGDGVVDLLDYQIWKSHVGIENGATVLDGDADGDGDVDGADFLFWQRNVGKPMPWSGSGSGSGSALASVPEPTSLLLLACGGSLALAFGRRRVER